jgi:MFS family permease
MFSFRSKLFPFWLVPLIIGQVITVAAIPDLINQPLQVILAKQRLPVGLIIGAFFLTFSICGLLFGRVTDRYGPKKLLIVFLPALVGTLTLYPLANTTREYVTVRILNAIAYSLVVNALIVLMRMSVHSGRHVQARITGFTSACSYLGAGLAMFFGLKLSDNVGKLWLTVEIMGLLSAGLILWGMTLIHSHEQVPMRQKVLRLVRKAVSNSLEEAKRLFDKDAFLISLPSLGISAVYLAFLTYFALYVGGESVATILLLTALTNGVASLTFVPKLVVTKGYRTVMSGSILLLIGSLILIRVGEQFWLLLLAGMMVGIAISTSSLCMSEKINQRVYRGRLGAGVATYGFLRQIGGVIGTSYSGIMWGFWKADMWLSLIPLLLVALFLLFSIRLKPRRGSSKTQYLAGYRSLEMDRHRAAWAIANQHGDFTTLSSSVRSFEQRLMDTRKLQELSPEVLAQRIQNMSLAIALLHHVQRSGLSRLSSEIITQTRRQLITHLKMLDRQDLRHYLSKIGYPWPPEEKVKDFAYQLEIKNLLLLPNTEGDLQTVRKYLEAIRILSVLDETGQKQIDQELQD